MGQSSWEVILLVVVFHNCFVFVFSQGNSLTNLQVGVGPTGQVLLLLILLMVALFGIPIYLWIWRNYLKKIVNKVTGKVQVRRVRETCSCCNLKSDVVVLIFLLSSHFRPRNTSTKHTSECQCVCQTPDVRFPNVFAHEKQSCIIVHSQMYRRSFCRY